MPASIDRVSSTPKTDGGAPWAASRNSVSLAMHTLYRGLGVKDSGSERSPLSAQTWSASRESTASEQGASSELEDSGAAGATIPGFPTHPTPAQFDQLTDDIVAGIATHPGLSAADPDITSPDTLTPLQAALFKAANGIGREELKSHPALLAAVQQGFATPGGQQLALVTNVLDATLVGDVSAPSRRSLLDGMKLLKPETLARVLFHVQPGAPASVLAAATAWVRTAQSTPAGLTELAALNRGGPVTLRTDDGRPVAAIDRGGRTIVFDASETPAEVKAAITSGLTDIAAVPRGSLGIAAVQETPSSPAQLINEALVFDQSIPLETQRIILTAAAYSPTLRNMLAASPARNGKITVSVDDTLQFGAQFAHPFDGSPGAIALHGESPEKMASNIIFELANGAVPYGPVIARPANSEYWFINAIAMEQQSIAHGEPQANDDLDAYLASQEFKDWNSSPDPLAPPGPGGVADRVRPQSALESNADYRKYLAADKGLIGDMLDSTFGHEKVLDSVFQAVQKEVFEIQSVVMHAAVASEVADGIGAVGNGVPARTPLSAEAIAQLSVYENTVTADIASGNALNANLNRNFHSGHTANYFAGALEDELFVTTALPGVELASRASAAGTATAVETRTAAEANAAHGGGAAEAAARDAVEANVRNASSALAEQILKDPNVLKAFEVGGKALTALAVAALVAQLGEAIYHDIVNGDHRAHETRKVLGELIGGVAGLEVGAAAGAAAGAATGALAGSAVPVVGNVVGAFIGGLLGGIGGGIAGYDVGSGAGGLIESLARKPVDALIDSLFPETTPGQQNTGLGGTDEAYASRFVHMGSGDDAHANASELKDGFRRLGFAGVFDDEQLDLLISAYDSDGNGALSIPELTQAIHDGALVIEGNQTGINTYAAVTTVAGAAAAPQTGTVPGQGNDDIAINTARRVLAAGSSNDAWANREELEHGFDAAGYAVQADDDAMNAVIDAYSGSDNGAITAEELAAAITDGVVVLQQDGTVVLHTAALPAA